MDLERTQKNQINVKRGFFNIIGISKLKYMATLFSPFYKNTPCNVIKTIPAKLIIKGYKSKYNMDVSRFFENSEIKVYQCPKSNYQFFHPYEIAGDNQFYQEIQNIKDYYIPLKWEHHQTLKIIQNHSDTNLNILEIGSGSSGFIKHLNTKYNITGIELNTKEVSRAKEMGLNVLSETIEEHARKIQHQYDVICNFQVLEHIADVNSFLSSSIKALASNGLMCIGVPNNDSFIKDHNYNLLNMPPHHMGLWTPQALEHLQEVYDIKLVSIDYEPLQIQHYGHYYNTKCENTFGEFIGKIIAKLSRPLAKKIISSYAQNVIGETVLATFQKK